MLPSDFISVESICALSSEKRWSLYGFNSVCIVKGIRPKLTFMSTEQEYMSAICARGASPSKTFWQGILTACMTDHTHADTAIRGSQPRRISSDTNQYIMSRIVHIAARYFHWEMNFLSTWHTLMRMKISVNLMVSVIPRTSLNRSFYNRGSCI